MTRTISPRDARRARRLTPEERIERSRFFPVRAAAAHAERALDRMQEETEKRDIAPPQNALD